MTNERPFHEQYEVRASNGNQALEDLTAARARIAELEDWQRRAVSWMLMQGADVKSPFVRAKLVGEAPV